MSKIAYVNGQYLPQQYAYTHIEDRGYQFSDGVYEVCAIKNKRMLELERHLDRLERSLHEIKLFMPMSRNSLIQILKEVIRRNKTHEGIIYLQITRGQAARNHTFPIDPKPILSVTTAPVNKTTVEQIRTYGTKVITLPDQRWARCDIKSVSLLPNILAKQTANEQGAQEAWQYDENDYITEGAATNAWIVDQNDTLRTRPANNRILNGVTRQRLLEIIKKENLPFKETAFTKNDAYQAKEAFSTASTLRIIPVTSIDNYIIGSGKIGNITKELLFLYENILE